MGLGRIQSQHFFREQSDLLNLKRYRLGKTTKSHNNSPHTSSNRPVMVLGSKLYQVPQLCSPHFRYYNRPTLVLGPNMSQFPQVFKKSREDVSTLLSTLNGNQQDKYTDTPFPHPLALALEGGSTSFNNLVPPFLEGGSTSSNKMVPPFLEGRSTSCDKMVPPSWMRINIFQKRWFLLPGYPNTFRPLSPHTTHFWKCDWQFSQTHIRKYWYAG